MASKLANKIFNSTRSRPVKMPSATPLGSPGYDNPRDDIEKVKKLREGSIIKTPVNDIDIANKAYVDSVAGVFDANIIVVLDGAVATLDGNVLILQ